MEAQALGGSTPPVLRWSVKQTGDCTWLEPGRGMALGGYLGCRRKRRTRWRRCTNPTDTAGWISTASRSTPSRSARWWRRPALVPGTRLESERPSSGLGVRFPPPPPMELSSTNLVMYANGKQPHCLCGEASSILVITAAGRLMEGHLATQRCQDRPPPTESHDLGRVGSIPSPATQARCCR